MQSAICSSLLGNPARASFSSSSSSSSTRDLCQSVLGIPVTYLPGLYHHFNRTEAIRNPGAAKFTSHLKTRDSSLQRIRAVIPARKSIVCWSPTRSIIPPSSTALTAGLDGRITAASWGPWYRVALASSCAV